MLVVTRWGTLVYRRRNSSRTDSGEQIHHEGSGGPRLKSEARQKRVLTRISALQRSSSYPLSSIFFTRPLGQRLLCPTRLHPTLTLRIQSLLKRRTSQTAKIATAALVADFLRPSATYSCRHSRGNRAPLCYPIPRVLLWGIYPRSGSWAGLEPATFEYRCHGGGYFGILCLG